MRLKTIHIFLVVILLFLSCTVTWILINRQIALKNPLSCLSVKKQSLKNVQLGSFIPICDITGKWRAKQINDGGNQWCVTPDGKIIAGSYTPVGAEPKQCKGSKISDIYVRMIDLIFNY